MLTPNPMSKPYAGQFASLKQLLEERIVYLDGAMGTMIQGYALEESDFRGERFKDHSIDLKGNNDLLTLTRPDIIQSIHRSFLEAGSDIIETNTFSSTAIAQADYGLESIVYELNQSAAQLARSVADAVSKEENRPIFVGVVPSDPPTEPARCHRMSIALNTVRSALINSSKTTRSRSRLSSGRGRPLTTKPYLIL